MSAISKGGAALAAVALLLGAIHVFLDVALRAVGIALPGTLEYVMYVWMPLIVFAAMSGAWIEGEHLRATLISERLPTRWHAGAEVLAALAFFACLALMAYFLMVRAVDAVAINEAKSASGVSVPIWPTRFVAAVGIGLAAMQALTEVRSILSGRRVPDEPALECEA